MKRHIFGGICQVLFRKKWGDFNYEQRKSLEKSRLRIPRRYFYRGGVLPELILLADTGTAIIAAIVAPIIILGTNLFNFITHIPPEIHFGDNMKNKEEKLRIFLFRGGIVPGKIG